MMELAPIWSTFDIYFSIHIYSGRIVPEFRIIFVIVPHKEM